MGWLPGWSSAEGAGWWGQLFFWASMLCLVMLGVTQVISHAYGLRRAELVALSGKAVDDPRTAPSPAPQAVSPGTPVAGPSANPNLQDGRRLTPEQYRAVVAGVKRLKSRSVIVSIPMEDLEAVSFAAQFVSAFQEAGWRPQQVAYSGAPLDGIQVTVNAAEAYNGRYPAESQELIAVLLKQGLTQSVFHDAAVQPGEIELRIGRREPAAQAVTSDGR